MDPRERADAILARARARGAFVVTPESAVSPMDAANTLQIPRAVVAAADERDPEQTMVVPAAELPAIAQEALTDVVAVPHPGPRSRQRRLEQHQNMLAAREAATREPEEVEGLVPTLKEPPTTGSLSQRLEG
ncbi:hypothetical protein [Actinophytocola algeriensis]|jgi:hypothetical protein|uniref:Uncharacterized protein n=1 Tax=Actinophytocola algeriensis TaxID=1768010 RepID=A0A7W7PZ79_9PSEU|nr:hypothetical protein [Actinophytocola algeriensis]MBB4903923.1 hypothetical protein [Actinophytocola algeriensis]MBE1477220.1 hypothetical protein [Actinophytocola algeriensis]